MRHGVVLSALMLNLLTPVKAHESQHMDPRSNRVGNPRVANMTRFASQVSVHGAQGAQPEPLAAMIRRRKALMERDGLDALKNQMSFNIDVTPPIACQSMSITFSTLGGEPPFNVLVGFDDWFSYSVSIPSTYADPNVNTWLYDFAVPSFTGLAGFSSTPEMFVVVGDSTGALLNTSSFKTVMPGITNCPRASLPLDFDFYTSDNDASCANIQLTWQSNSNTSISYVAPLDAYLIPQQRPPIHYTIPNATVGELNATLPLPPGTAYMLIMTDKNGAGGVSGYNLVGLNEYIGTACLTQTSTLQYAMPTATTTLASNVRMPAFSGTISSLVTSNGVVTTATSVHVVQNGTIQYSKLSNGQIVGISIGGAVLAALLAALISWYVWSKRRGRRIAFWDLPKGADSDLAKANLHLAPIDREYIQTSWNSRQMSMQGTGVGAVAAAGAARSSGQSSTPDGSSASPVDTGVYRDARPATPSNGTYSTSQSRPYHTLQSATTSNGRRATLNRPLDDEGTVPSEADALMANRASSPEGTAASVPGLSSTLSPHSASQTSPQSSSLNSSGPTGRTGTIIQHNDAGLLMDDSLDDEDMMGRVELPPSYSQIPRQGSRDAAQRGQTLPRDDGPRDVMEELRSTNDPRPIGTRLRSPQDEDDSEFWIHPSHNSSSS